MASPVLPRPLEKIYRQIRDFTPEQLAVLVVEIDAMITTSDFRRIVKKVRSFPKNPNHLA